jgi:hypothetical protein
VPHNFGMNISIPSVDDIAKLLTALEQHPLGSVFLVVLALIGVAAIVAWRMPPTPLKRFQSPRKP